MGQTGLCEVLRSSANICGFLHFSATSAVSCSFQRKSASLGAVFLGGAQVSNNLWKSAIKCEFGFVYPFHLVSFTSPGPEVTTYHFAKRSLSAENPVTTSVRHHLLHSGASLAAEASTNCHRSSSGRVFTQSWRSDHPKLSRIFWVSLRIIFPAVDVQTAVLVSPLRLGSQHRIPKPLLFLISLILVICRGQIFPKAHVTKVRVSAPAPYKKTTVIMLEDKPFSSKLKTASLIKKSRGTQTPH